MIIDAALKLSTAQALLASAASANVVDFGQANPNSGNGFQLYAVVTVGVAFAGATSLQVSVQDSADNTTFADALLSAAVPVASLGAGAQIVIPMPTKHRRYVRLNYTVAGTGTAGAVDAQIVTGIQQNTIYPDAI